MIKETNESFTVEFSQSDIGNNLDNTLMEGAEIRKNNISKELEFQNLVLRPDSPQIHTENNIDQQAYIRRDSKSSQSYTIQGDNTSDCLNLPLGIAKPRSFSRQNGGRNSIALFNPQKFSAALSADASSIFAPVRFGDAPQGTPKRKSVLNEIKINQSLMLMSQQIGHSSVFSGQKSTFKKAKTMQSMGKLQQILIIKQMIQRIMRYVPSAKYAKLTPLHFEVINDNALILKDQNSLSGLMASLPTLQPNSILFDLWKIFQIILVGFHLFRVLLMIGFQDETLQLQETIRIVSLVFFILDCFLGLNAGFYEGQTIVTDRIRIFQNNPLEITSTVLSIAAMAYSNNPYINLIFVIRLRSLFTNISVIEQNFSLNQKYPILVTITKLLLLIILIAHTFACGFVLITYFEKDAATYWIKKQILIGEPWEKIYLTSLYFAFITMITVGYGDITPITDIERAYVIFFTLITCIVYAYVVNTIGSLFSEFALKSAEFKRQRFQIVSYLNDRRISKPIQISVIKYLEYTQQQEKVLKYSKAGEQFLASIPQSLRQEAGVNFFENLILTTNLKKNHNIINEANTYVILKKVCEDYYGRILDQVTIFKKYFSKSCINALSQIMKEETFGPEARIFSQDEHDFKLFFVMQGKVEILIHLKDSQNSHRCLGYLKKGQSYGEKSLFSTSSWNVTAKCLENTSIIYMRKEEFINVLKEFRNDYEIYCMLRDKTMPDMEVLELKCTGCFQKDHEVSNCELLYYKPRKSFLISKYNYDLKQEKRDQSIVRKGPRSEDSWKNNILVRRQLKKLRIFILNREFNNIISRLSKKNGSLFDLISEDKPELDERFFSAIPEFYYHENEIVIALEEEDLNYESHSGSDSQDLDIEFDALLEKQLNSPENKRINFKQSSAVRSQDLIPLESFSKQSQQFLAPVNENGFPGPQNSFEKKMSTFFDSQDCSIQCVPKDALIGNTSMTNIGSAQNILIISNNNNMNLTGQANHNIAQGNISTANNFSSGNNLLGSYTTNYQNNNSNNNNNPSQFANLPSLNPINNTNLTSNHNNTSHQLSNGNNAEPLSCQNPQARQIISQNFFPSGEINYPTAQIDSQPILIQQNNQHVSPSLRLRGSSRSPSHNKRKGSLPPIQRQNSNDRNLGITPTHIQRMLQQKQNGNTQNQQTTFSAIYSSNSVSETNIPLNPVETNNNNGVKQIQLYMCPSSEFQQSKHSNNGSPINRDQVLGESENNDQRTKQPYFNQIRPGRQRKLTQLTNKGFYNPRKSANYDEEQQAQVKRNSKKKVTIFKDSVHLSVLNTKDRSFSNFAHCSSSLLNPQKNISENQLNIDSRNNNGNNNNNNNNTYLQEELQAKDLFVLMNFDLMHEYLYYFPNFNYPALRFKNKADMPAYQHVSKSQHQNYFLKKNISSIRP